MLALLIPARGASAQDKPPQVTVAISRDTVDLGDSLIFQVTVDGASSAEEPAFPGSDAYKAEYLGGRDESSRSIPESNRMLNNSLRLRNA